MGNPPNPQSAIPNPPSLHLVVFRLGNELYGIDIAHTREILDPPPITPIPLTPAFVLGVINVRGEIIGCIDPRRLLGLPPAAGRAGEAVVVIAAAGKSLALLVDAIAGTRRCTAEEVEPPPPTLGGGTTAWFVGLGRAADRPLLLLDLEKLMAAPELVALYE